MVKATSCANSHLHNLASDRLYEVVFEIVVCSLVVVEKEVALEANEVSQICF